MKKYAFLWMVWSLALMTSCSSSKKIVYLEDMQPDSLYAYSRPDEMKIRQADRLSIVINSKNPELTAPFNLGTGAYQMNTEGEIITNSNSVARERGYTVNSTGDIDFPILGTLHVEGLTRHELAEQIKEHLITEELINDPLVTVNLLNLKISMMGEVGRVGVLSVPDSRITLLEAISQAGGLKDNARLDNVAVIREEAGVRKMLLNDLRSVSVFDSPGFWLQQNDIVYVQERFAKRTVKEERGWRLYSTGLGLVSLAVSVLILFNQY